VSDQTDRPEECQRRAAAGCRRQVLVRVGGRRAGCQPFVLVLPCLAMHERFVAQTPTLLNDGQHYEQRIATHGGVLFVNDSKATNPTATAPALAAYPAIHWILGGQAKTDNLDDCVPYFSHVRAAYTIGEAGPLFAKLLAPHMPVTQFETLAKALTHAAAAAQPGETVLLSPACASFDQFTDFEARGDAFRALVEAL